MCIYSIKVWWWIDFSCLTVEIAFEFQTCVRCKCLFFRLRWLLVLIELVLVMKPSRVFPVMEFQRFLTFDCGNCIRRIRKICEMQWLIFPMRWLLVFFVGVSHCGIRTLRGENRSVESEWNHWCMEKKEYYGCADLKTKKKKFDSTPIWDPPLAILIWDPGDRIWTILGSLTKPCRGKRKLSPMCKKHVSYKAAGCTQFREGFDRKKETILEVTRRFLTTMRSLVWILVEVLGFLAHICGNVVSLGLGFEQDRWFYCWNCLGVGSVVF